MFWTRVRLPPSPQMAHPARMGFFVGRQNCDCVQSPFSVLGKIVQSGKSFTGRWVKQHNAELELGVPGKSLWMREYWDRYIRNEEHLHKVIEYIHQNPVKAGLCQVPESFRVKSEVVKQYQ